MKCLRDEEDSEGVEMQESVPNEKLAVVGASKGIGARIAKGVAAAGVAIVVKFASDETRSQ